MTAATNTRSTRIATLTARIKAAAAAKAPVTTTIESGDDEIKALAPKMRTVYLRNFFAEKNIPEMAFDFEDSEGTWHHMPNMVVVEHMVGAPLHELKKIEEILRKIDFANGNVNHFLAHLARGIAETRLQNA